MRQLPPVGINPAKIGNQKRISRELMSTIPQLPFRRRGNEMKNATAVSEKTGR